MFYILITAIIIFFLLRSFFKKHQSEEWSDFEIPEIEDLKYTPKFERNIQEKEEVYRKRTSVMNDSESAFFFELKKQLPVGYHIFPKMRIADMIYPIHGKGFYFRRNKILPKHVDFLVCDSTFKPIVAIEVNGGSHMRTDRAERDILVNKIFEDAKLPLVTVEVRANFSEFVTKLKETFYDRI